MLIYIVFICREQIGTEKVKQCAPRLRKNMPVKATRFCKTCRDSERFCEMCSQHHTSQIEEENHEMSEDLKQYECAEDTAHATNFFFWFSYILNFFSWLYSWLKSLGHKTGAQPFNEGHLRQ